MKKLLIICLLAAVALCTGCPRNRSVADQTPAAGECVPQPEAVSDLDSIVCGEGCTTYTCYFARGTRSKKALENIQSVVFGSFTTDVDSDDDPQTIDRYRTRYLDSLARLEWLDSEPWPSVHDLLMKWSKQQLDRYYIVAMAQRNPQTLCHCSETDSVLIRCADILSKGGDGFVGGVRQLWTESEYAKAARDSAVFDRSYLEHTFERMDRVLGGSDSTANAREHLFVLLSNHINNKIHDRLGKNGPVDFYSYTDDYLRIFDNVKVDTEEP